MLFDSKQKYVFTNTFLDLHECLTFKKNIL